MNRYLSILLLLASLVVGLPAQGLFETGNSANNGSLDPSLFGCIQTFTIVRDGVLESARVRIAAPSGGTLTYKLLPTTTSVNPGGQPVLNAAIYSASISLSSDGSFQWIELDLSAPQIAVTAGDTLALQVNTSASCSYADSTGNPYATGIQWIDTTFGLGSSTLRDFAFQVYLHGAVLDDQNSYFEDFETSAGGWTVTNGLWEYGTPAQNYISQASSGSKCWMTDLDANYADSAFTAVTSPWFDCSQALDNCRVSAWISYQTDGWNDGFRLEYDLDDGVGWQAVGHVSWYGNSENSNVAFGLDGDFWGGGQDSSWIPVQNTIPGSAGQARMRLRFLFGSDSAYSKEGAAFDDVVLEIPKIAPTASVPYFEDFDQPGDGWSAAATIDAASTFGTLPIWERGSPAGIMLSDAYSGSSCWATDLDGIYPIRAEARLTSPSCDFSNLNVDPVLEFALRHQFEDTEGYDGLRVEVDLGDGNGFQTLGTVADWYDGNLSSNYGIGGPGWRGMSSGWRLLRHSLTGCAGLTDVRIRFHFSSNIHGVGEGALIDDVHIFVPTFKGTETTLADDIRMQVYVDGKRDVGASDASILDAGAEIEVFSISSEGDLVGGEYYLVAEIFATGGSYTNVASDVWISLGPGSVLLQGGVQPPFYVPMQMGPSGASHFYYYGGGAAGYSCRVQALIFKPQAVNGLYASSDAFELQFN